MNTSQFVKAFPGAVKAHLPKPLKGFKHVLMPWLVQLYYDDKNVHYELAKLPSKYGENRLEIGLHCESRDHHLNAMLLAGFERYLFEVRDQLGENWWAEPWDRGWTKIYTTYEYHSMDEALLEQLAGEMAKSINVLHPLHQLILSTRK